MLKGVTCNVDICKFNNGHGGCRSPEGIKLEQEEAGRIWCSLICKIYELDPKDAHVLEEDGA